MLRSFPAALVAAASMTLLAACAGGRQNSALPAGPVPGAQPGRVTAGSQALVYVADQGNQRVEIYAQKGKDQSPIGRITDAISAPDGLFVDPSGTLYVCNFGNGTVTEYPQGQTTHSKTLTGAGSPKYVVVGNGTVYVSNFNASANGQVLEYAGGSTTPTATISFQTFPAGLALDSHNRLYVAYNDSNNSDIEVLRFAPGKTQGKNLGIHIQFGYAGGATIDHQGDLLIADQSRSLVDVFPPGATQPSQQLGGFTIAYQIALNKRNTHLYVTSPSGVVAEVAYPSGTPIDTISNSLGGAYGVATSPEGSR